MHSVDQKEWRPSDHQLPGATHPSSPPHQGMARKQLQLLADLFIDAQTGRWVVFAYVVEMLKPIAYSRREPADRQLAFLPAAADAAHSARRVAIRR